MVEYTPAQLKVFGYKFPEIIIISLAIYFTRVLTEIIAIRLGIDIIDLFIKIIWRWLKAFFQYIRGLTYSIHLRVGDNSIKTKTVGKGVILKRLANLISRFLTNGKQTKAKIVTFFKVTDDIGILVSNSIPLMPTSIPALLYNLRQRHQPWYKFNNLSFAALVTGGIIRMSIVIWLTT
ncbi:MAG: hypothetical protein WC575_00990 [Patescibacteria group bacterium]